MNDRQKQLINLAQVIHEAVEAGFKAGHDASVLRLSYKQDPEEIENKIYDLKQEAKEKLCGKWIPKTDLMSGDVVA